jgi:chromosome segregation ATPase
MEKCVSHVQARMNEFSIEEQATRYKETSEKLQSAKRTVGEKRDEVTRIERELAALNEEINRSVPTVASGCLCHRSSGYAQ